MLPLTIAQHHRKCLFHFAVEVVVLNVVQGDVQTHACPIIVSSNRQPVTWSWPVYKDLELVPRRDERNIAAFVFHDFTVLHCASDLCESQIGAKWTIPTSLTGVKMLRTAHVHFSLLKLPPQTDAFHSCYSPLMKRPVSFVLQWVRLAVISVS